MTDERHTEIMDEGSLMTNEIIDDSVDIDELEIEDLEPDAEAGARAGRLRTFARLAVPVTAMLLALGSGFVKYQTGTLTGPDPDDTAVRAAADGAVAMLTYHPDSVEQDLDAAKDRLTGSFLDDYTKLAHDVVIPGARLKKVTATATVPAASSVSAGPDHAVVLLFVDQTVTVGHDAPANTSSSVRVTLDRVGQRWLISEFKPV